MTETPNTAIKRLQGKTKNKGSCVMRVYCSAIEYPIQYPTNNPIKQLDSTSTKASYMYSLIIVALEFPMALKTDISLHYSSRLADIDDDNEKNDRAMTTTVSAVKIIVIRLSFYS